MKSIIYTLCAIVLLAVADWLWYQYWYHFGRLAMTRTDGYHVIVRGRCYTR